jgi:hypothetical protein
VAHGKLTRSTPVFDWLEMDIKRILNAKWNDKLKRKCFEIPYWA